MPSDAPQQHEAEVAAIIGRLREELQKSWTGGDDAVPPRLGARWELDRLWAVTAERPYLSRPGTWGRIRGLVLMPPKALLRRLMRWYVEPLAVDQRAFNAAVVRALDELAAWTASEIEQLEPSKAERPRRLADSSG